MRDAPEVLDFADVQLRSGHSADEVLAMRDPLCGFEEYGPFGRQGPGSR